MAAPDPRSFDARWRAAQRHQPFFCEENVWHLLQAVDVPRPAAALFVTNRVRAVAMWGQRQGPPDPVVWDYHVVVLCPAAGLVIDLDDRRRAAWWVGDWLANTFRPGEAHAAPWFRRVADGDFLRTFSTDRSHMADAAGRPLRPLPPWPPPFQPALGMTLQRFLDLDDPIAGEIIDAASLRRWSPR